MAHAFIDGNKRVAAAVSETFLLINDWQLDLNNAELVDMFLKIADGAWLREAIEHMFRRVPFGWEGSAHASSGQQEVRRMCPA